MKEGSSINGSGALPGMVEYGEWISLGERNRTIGFEDEIDDWIPIVAIGVQIIRIYGEGCVEQLSKGGNKPRR